jgi:UDPglucose 6-dehydrogenase
VYSICLAEIGHEVTAYDSDETTINNFNKLTTPTYEPGLIDLLRKNLEKKSIVFTNDPTKLSQLDILIVAYDTPVDANDFADDGYVLSKFKGIAPYVSKKTKVIISSQLPVGTSQEIKKIIGDNPQSSRVLVHPENLRLGMAIESFFSAERIIVGTTDGSPDLLVEKLFIPLNIPIIWMHNESAEMTKHALNAFLALSITFMGEISSICEQTGADAKEVEIGVKSDPRVGVHSYLKPGLGFAGGTLARDIRTLTDIQSKNRTDKTVLNSVMLSNEYNNDWIRRQLFNHKLNPESKICFWGVTYTKNTNTLRRSEIYDLMKSLVKSQYVISYVEDLEIIDDIDSEITCENDIGESIASIDVLVVTKKLTQLDSRFDVLNLLTNSNFIILDPYRLLPELNFKANYITVGRR